MSHISILKTRLSDKSILLETLQAMGYEVTESPDLMTQGSGRKTKVDFQIEVPYSDPIGFRESKNGYQIVADWFKIQLDRKQFQSQLLQQYAYHAVTSALTDKGFEICKEEVSEKNQIHLVVRRCP